MKLVVVEPETEALRRYLVAAGRPVTSLVSRIEVARALLRRGLLEAASLDELWARVTIMPIDIGTADTAARLGPPMLRSLDAIHLATALALQPELRSFLTYDTRLADAARALGLQVLAPG